MKHHYWAIIPAAGLGTRMGSTVKKQFMKLSDGREILIHTLERFEAAPQIEGIVLACAADDIAQTQALIEQYHLAKVRKIVHGGVTRQLSVYAALQTVPEECDFAVIHDAARPYLTAEDLEKALADAEANGACSLAIPVKDTIKETDTSGFVKRTPDRSHLWQVQTPQVLPRKELLEAHNRAYVLGDVTNTDDAQVLEKHGKVRVHLCFGSYANIKVTTPDDLK